MLVSTVPKSEYLLDSATAFDANETGEFLFGDKFLAAIANQAKLDQIFDQIGGVKQPTISGMQTRFKARGASSSSTKGKKLSRIVQSLLYRL